MPNLPTQPCALTIAQASVMLREKTLSPVDLVDSVLDRIEETEGKLHAYAFVAVESVRKAAKVAEQEIMDGKWRSPLHGIPIALKDVYRTAGIPTEAESRLLKGYVPEEDSGVADRLKQGGAVIVGKTVTPEFAYFTYPREESRARNPWNFAYHPGGSSTGSGVSVAADSAMGAMGTDSGGSIRKPAAMNGIAGLKPSFGRVTKRGVLQLSATMDHCGPLCKTVEDVALVMNVVAGYDPDDVTSIDVPLPNLTDDLNRGARGLRLGVERKHFFSEDVVASVRSSVDSALTVFETLGAVVVDVEIPDIDYAIAAASTIVLVEASSYHRRWLRERPGDYEPGTRFMLQLGNLITATDYLQALQIRRRFKATMKDVFERNQLAALLTPTLSYASITLAERFPPPNEHDRGIPIKWNSHCMPFNFTGQPALSIPCGFTSDNLPVGLQIVGRPFDESTVLRIGKAYEIATTWHLKAPPI